MDTNAERTESGTAATWPRRTPRFSRRDVLRLGGAAALATTVAACTGSDKQPAPGASATSTLSASKSPETASASATATASADPSSSSNDKATPSPSSRRTTPSGSTAPKPTFDDLASKVSGGLKRRGQRGYDSAALLYNPRFARQRGPEAIAGCRTADDVAACIRFAAEGGAGLRIRNGGHSYGGWSSGPGLVADLAAMNRVQVNTGSMTAKVGAGALLVDVYGALDSKGVAIGAGSCPTVGVTGLTLGGGVGVLSRAYGLTCDQVVSFDVVTADGSSRTVSARAEPDLFWALRGGGGSFAAVTALTFRLHRAPQTQRFYLQWSWSHAAVVLGAWQQWIGATPRELWSTCKLLGDPGAGLKATVSGTWIGSKPLDTVLSPLLAKLPKPATDSRHVEGYGATMLAEAGCAGDDPSSCVNHALSFSIRQPFAATSSILDKALPSAGVAAAVAAVGNGVDVGTGALVEVGMSFDSLGGAVSDVDASATAYPWRAGLALVQHTATWKSGSAGTDPAPFDSFVRGARKALTPWAGTSAYVNYADAAIVDYANAYWGDNLARLRKAKATYDPHNVFTFPQAVPR